MIDIISLRSISGFSSDMTLSREEREIVGVVVQGCLTPETEIRRESRPMLTALVPQSLIHGSYRTERRERRERRKRINREKGKKKKLIYPDPKRK